MSSSSEDFPLPATPPPQAGVPSAGSPSATTSPSRSQIARWHVFSTSARECVTRKNVFPRSRKRASCSAGLTDIQNFATITRCSVSSNSNSLISP